MAFKMKGSAFKLGNVATKSALKDLRPNNPEHQKEYGDSYAHKHITRQEKMDYGENITQRELDTIYAKEAKEGKIEGEGKKEGIDEYGASTAVPMKSPLEDKQPKKEGETTMGQHNPPGEEEWAHNIAKHPAKQPDAETIKRYKDLKKDKKSPLEQSDVASVHPSSSDWRDQYPYVRDYHKAMGNIKNMKPRERRKAMKIARDETKGSETYYDPLLPAPTTGFVEQLPYKERGKYKKWGGDVKIPGRFASKKKKTEFLQALEQKKRGAHILPYDAETNPQGNILDVWRPLEGESMTHEQMEAYKKEGIDPATMKPFNE